MELVDPDSPLERADLGFVEGAKAARDDERTEPPGASRGEVERAEHSSPCRDEVGSVDLQHVEHGGQVIREGARLWPGVGPGLAASPAAPVEGDDAVAGPGE